MFYIWFTFIFESKARLSDERDGEPKGGGHGGGEGGSAEATVPEAAPSATAEQQQLERRDSADRRQRNPARVSNSIPPENQWP